MEGESRKRKMGEEEEESEEEKMQKFFALIRSTRDLRDRLVGSGAEKSRDGEKKKDGEEKPVEVWNPSFRPEDFMEGGNHSKSKDQPTSLAGPSKRDDKSRDEEEDREGGGGNRGGDGLDLNLSL
ncbi:hypothetical protein NMG60_11020942 [Bertholletia excelsa]